MPASQNLYSILNVSPDADPAVIEAAYKALMKKYHPDTGGADPRRAAAITQAFTVLKDPEKRADYNLRHVLAERQFMSPDPREIPRAPRTRMFALSGWIAALAFGGALAFTVSRENAALQRPPTEIAAAEGGSQPASPPRGSEALDVDALDAEAILAEAARTPPDVAPPPLKPEELVAPLSGSAALAVNLPRPRAAPRAPKRPVARAAPQRKPVRNGSSSPQKNRQDPDFLEREGYIY
jgi:hypothetical protein